MRPISLSRTYAAAVTTSIAALQAPTSGTALTLVATPTLSPQGYITLTSAADLSAINFAVVGLDDNNGAVTETIAGPNANTVTSTKSYARITSITPNGTSASTVSVGKAQAGFTSWIPLDIYVPNQVTTISATVTGTINYTVQYTNEDPFVTNQNQQAVSHPVAGLVGATTSQTASTTTLMRAVRLLVSSGGGTATMTVVQQSVQ